MKHRSPLCTTPGGDPTTWHPLPAYRPERSRRTSPPNRHAARCTPNLRCHSEFAGEESRSLPCPEPAPYPPLPLACHLERSREIWASQVSTAQVRRVLRLWASFPGGDVSQEVSPPLEMTRERERPQENPPRAITRTGSFACGLWMTGEDPWQQSRAAALGAEVLHACGEKASCGPFAPNRPHPNPSPGARERGSAPRVNTSDSARPRQCSAHTLACCYPLSSDIPLLPTPHRPAPRP